eukprot:TRINITY_DN26283_c0_g1_i1.p1 TRINITY_DN26283_c0_g1~~TRINITY_DN26283_c0_g1_i1.p1  ORF type:complete len:220 (-),score=42.45 TRINITY_DN26283_c0_g1_i1:967-1626(-)
MGTLLPAISTQVSTAVLALKRQEVIALPSDTLYGLAADACSGVGVQRIYAAKARQNTKPLAVCVADVADVERFAATEHLPRGLLDALFPGPVTLVLPRQRDSPLAASLNPGVLGIGVRIPDAPFIREVAREFDGALALTSANRSGGLSSVRVEEFEELWPFCAAVFDGGELKAGRAGSTVVTLEARGHFRIIRRGSAAEETTAVLRQRFGLEEQFGHDD